MALIDPAAVPRAAPDWTLVQTIVHRFCLGQVHGMHDLGGTYNLNLLLQTQEPVVLRVYRPWVDYARLIQIQRVRIELARAGLPVLSPLSSPDGETVAHYGDRVAELELWVPHQRSDDWAHRTLAIEMLARLHDALRAMNPAGFVPPQVSNYGQPSELLHLVRSGMDRVSGDQSARGIMESSAGVLESLLVPWEDYAPHLPFQLTHGDYGVGNVGFSSGRVALIMDFDFVAVRERVFDLAYSMYWMLARSEDTGHPQALPWSRLAALIRRYNDVASKPLTPAEWHALPYEMARVPLYWAAEAGMITDPVPFVLPLEAAIRFAGWLSLHTDYVRMALGA